MLALLLPFVACTFISSTCIEVLSCIVASCFCIRMLIAMRLTQSSTSYMSGGCVLSRGSVASIPARVRVGTDPRSRFGLLKRGGWGLGAYPFAAVVSGPWPTCPRQRHTWTPLRFDVRRRFTSQGTKPCIVVRVRNLVPIPSRWLERLVPCAAGGVCHTSSTEVILASHFWFCIQNWIHRFACV